MSWQLGSLVVVLLVIGTGLVWYERSRPPSQVVALVAVLAAMAVAGRVLLAPLPNVVATTDIVLFAGYALGPAPGFAVGALGGLISNFWLGQGIWTPWQMVGWGMAGVAGWVVWKVTAGRAGRLSLALACGLAGLVFGLWMNLQFLVGFGGEVTPDRYLALQVRSIPFDLAHIIGNVAFALIAGPAIISALERFRRRFEWQKLPGTAGMFLVAISLTLVAFPRPAEASQSKETRIAKSWLAGQQNSDGGFGASPRSDSSVTMTARVAIGLAAAGRNPLDVRRSGNSPIGYLRSNRAGIDGPSDLSLAILAVHASGADPRDFGGRNLVKRLKAAVDRDRTLGGRVNVAAYAALALRAADAPGTARKSVKWLKSAQAANGGWGVTASASSDPDSTGTVLQLLARGKRTSRALSYLESIQKSSGGFGYRGKVNSQSTGIVLQGLSSLGRKPSYLSESGRSGLDYLRSRQGRSGVIEYSKTSDQTPVWVTGDALIGLASDSLPVSAPPRTPSEPTPPPISAGDSGSTPSESSSGTGGSTSSGATGSPSSSGSASGSGSQKAGGDAEESFVPGPGTDQPGETAPGETAVPGIGPITPPSEAILAASQGGPGPSPGIAALIWALVSGGIGGATVLLARRFKW